MFVKATIYHFTKKVWDKLDCKKNGSNDPLHIIIIILSNRRMALIDDVDFINDLTRFPKFGNTIKAQRELTNQFDYKNYAAEHKKSSSKNSSIKLNMTFEEAMKKALNTPCLKKKRDPKINKMSIYYKFLRPAENDFTGKKTRITFDKMLIPPIGHPKKNIAMLKFSKIYLSSF